MSRLSKFLMVLGLIIFVLACNFVSQPIRDVQDIAETAQSFATALPVETLQALASAIPAETLQALPSVAPTLEALASALPDFGSYFNPQGTPAAEWNGIPIMSQATAGQEFDTNTYSFKVEVTAKEVQDFYDAQLTDLGWTQPFSMPGQADAALMFFQKDEQILTITIASTEGSVVVLLTLG